MASTKSVRRHCHNNKKAKVKVKKERCVEMGLSYGVGIFVLLALTLVFVAHGRGGGLYKIYNVNDYGAVADGQTDNSKAFLQAWREACDWEGSAHVWIPEGNYLVGATTFQGECKGPLLGFFINGMLRAPTNQSEIYNHQWLTFQYIDGLILSGGAKGGVDGQGHVSWPLNDCNTNPNCRPLPVSIRLNFVRNARVHHMRSINSKNSHIMVFGCENVTLSKIRLTAPGNSPNTDGINIGQSRHITIRRATIGTGDDCISVGPGSRDIEISKVRCGPGHGISVGSLGRYLDEEDVSGLSLRNCTFRNTSDGLRIKTWASPLHSKASHLVYRDVFMDNVHTPINIDQLYCPHPPCDHSASSGVEITDVRFTNIWGTTTSSLALTINCSSSVPCQDIVLQDINILPAQGSHSNVTTLCSNVEGRSFGKQTPPSCFH